VKYAKNEIFKKGMKTTLLLTFLGLAVVRNLRMAKIIDEWFVKMTNNLSYL
jgi:hypothetical protein